MAEYLLVSDSISPVADGDTALTAAGLAWALVGAKHRVTMLSLGAPEHVARLPGMARRLRTLGASVAGANVELPLFEGRAAFGQAPLYVVGTTATDRGHISAILAATAASLARDSLVKPDAVIGWGETSALSLSAVGATRELFVLPSGTAGPPLTADERAAIGPQSALDALSVNSLVALGAASADAVVVPSPSARRALEGHPALAARASDQPLVAVRFGCDEAPHDPASDPALAATFSAETLAGRAECRRALARRASLALGPRTLLLATAPLAGATGKAALEAIARLVRLDVAVAVSAASDKVLADRAGVLGIEHPGKVALVPVTEPGDRRALLAGADAVIFGEGADLTARAAGIALRYGALPIAPETEAHADYLVDHDAASATGSALLYTGSEAFEIEAAARRAISLRANPEHWQALVRSLMLTVPRWASTAALIERLEPVSEERPAG